jgi:hypothetical protein
VKNLRSFYLRLTLVILFHAVSFSSVYNNVDRKMLMFRRKLYLSSIARPYRQIYCIMETKRKAPISHTVLVQYKSHGQNLSSTPQLKLSWLRSNSLKLDAQCTLVQRITSFNNKPVLGVGNRRPTSFFYQYSLLFPSTFQLSFL